MPEDKFLIKIQNPFGPFRRDQVVTEETLLTWLNSELGTDHKSVDDFTAVAQGEISIFPQFAKKIPQNKFKDK